MREIRELEDQVNLYNKICASSSGKEWSVEHDFLPKFKGEYMVIFHEEKSATKPGEIDRGV
jgi:hypothetical protein